MRKLHYGMNVTLDGYVAAPGDEHGDGTSPTPAPGSGKLVADHQ